VRFPFLPPTVLSPDKSIWPAPSYCYGGVLSVLLAAEQSPTDVSVCAHPGKLDLADFENVRKPLAMVLAEREWAGLGFREWGLRARSDACSPRAPTEDHIFDDQKPAALAILDRIQSEHAVPIAIYDQHAGTTHGFGCRPDLENEAVKRAWELAAEETVGWFEGHL
jgi:carboxymethylenebutenolidase